MNTKILLGLLCVWTLAAFVQPLFIAPVAICIALVLFLEGRGLIEWQETHEKQAEILQKLERLEELEKEISSMKNKMSQVLTKRIGQ